MKPYICFAIVTLILMSCETKKASPPHIGTWQLISATIIEKGDTIVTDYSKDKKFIKIITDSHFAFIGHDLSKGKDSAAFFTSGAGSFTLADSTYSEHLEFCSDRAWENNDFKFTITIRNDTLVQMGIEKIESAGVDRLNVEKYVRMKNK